MLSLQGARPEHGALLEAPHGGVEEEQPRLAGAELPQDGLGEEEEGALRDTTTTTSLHHHGDNTNTRGGDYAIHYGNG